MHQLVNLGTATTTTSRVRIIIRVVAEDSLVPLNVGSFNLSVSV